MLRVVSFPHAPFTSSRASRSATRHSPASHKHPHTFSLLLIKLFMDSGDPEQWFCQRALAATPAPVCQPPSCPPHCHSTPRHSYYAASHLTVTSKYIFFFFFNPVFPTHQIASALTVSRVHDCVWWRGAGVRRARSFHNVPTEEYSISSDRMVRLPHTTFTWVTRSP